VDASFVPQEQFIMFWCFIPYDKSFIDQACSVKMAGYWPRSFLRVYELRPRKKELGQHPATFTSRMVNNSYVPLKHGLKETTSRSVHFKKFSIHFSSLSSLAIVFLLSRPSSFMLYYPICYFFPLLANYSFLQWNVDFVSNQNSHLRY